MYNNSRMYDGLSKMLDELVEDSKKSVKPEKCGDCISRETATHYLTKARLLGDSRPMKEIFAEIPSVEPERKMGKWEWDQRAGEYVCSECGCNPFYERTIPDASEIDKYRYCRWCGSRMEVDNG